MKRSEEMGVAIQVDHTRHASGLSTRPEWLGRLRSMVDRWENLPGLSAPNGCKATGATRGWIKQHRLKNLIRVHERACPRVIKEIVDALERAVGRH